MVVVNVLHQLNANQLRQLVASPFGGIAQDLLRRGLKVETLAKRNLAGGPSGPKRIDTGRLRTSISTGLFVRDGVPVVLVGTNVYYARWVHDGTGLYGPRMQRIRPKSARVLRFRGKSGGMVYVRSTKGMRSNHFLRDALPAARN